MKPNTQIKSVLITAGTHGNEMSGLAALDHWRQDDSKIASLAPSCEVHLREVNHEAITKKQRYIDEDLNRLFKPQTLSELETNLSKEAAIAREFNAQYGPKSQSSTDFIIDIHNTTSNMGPTLIIMSLDNFYTQLARFVKYNMPEANILVEDFQDYGDFGYLCTVGKKGVMIEVGPQAQGLLKAKCYQQTITMGELILEFLELYNNQLAPTLEPVEAFRLGEEVNYPVKMLNGQNTKTAMIHPDLEGSDFQLLKSGSPCFVDFEGNHIIWQGNDTYPHFIGEAAYDHLHIAFATADKIQL